MNDFISTNTPDKAAWDTAVQGEKPHATPVSKHGIQSHKGIQRKYLALLLEVELAFSYSLLTQSRRLYFSQHFMRFFYI